MTLEHETGRRVPGDHDAGAGHGTLIRRRQHTPREPLLGFETEQDRLALLEFENDTRCVARRCGRQTLMMLEVKATHDERACVIRAR